MMIRTPSGTVGYEATGEGVPFVLLHGFPHDRALWAAQLEAGVPGARLIAPDLPGFGQSSPAHPDGKMSSAPTATMDVWADWLADLLDALALDRVILGGLSMGGYLAFAMWRRHSRRVRALVLANTRAGADDDGARARRTAMQELVAAEGVAAVATRMAPGMIGKSTRESRPDVVAAVDAMMLRQTPRGIHDALGALRDRPDSTPTLATITAPVLIIGGSEDAIIGEGDARAMVRGVPGSRLEMIGASGHVSCVEQPETFTRLLAGFVADAARP